jgi:hypothetical protein
METKTKTEKRNQTARKSRITKREMLRMSGGVGMALGMIEGYDLDEGVVYPRDVQLALSAARRALKELEDALDGYVGEA